MGFFSESFATAAGLIVRADPEVLQAVATSVTCAVASTAIAAVVGVPLGALIATNQFRAKRAVVTLLNTLLALPTVVIGLVLYALLSRQGPLGALGLLFTPGALVLGQSVLAVPIVTSYAVSAVHGADTRVLPTAWTLGVGRLGSLVLVLREVRFGVVAAIIVGFGRVISEVGLAMMLGGNIRGLTRTMTTAIALETSKGEFAFGLALGLVLMAVALAVNLVLCQLQQR
jgi:tungstate transport system permease protein